MKKTLISLLTIGTLILTGAYAQDTMNDSSDDMSDTPMMDETMMDDTMSDDTMMDTMMSGTHFTVTIENISTTQTLNTPDGTLPVPLSPGVWVLHENSAPLFTGGKADRGHGLEAIAEDGNPAEALEYLQGNMMAGEFGVFNTPVGADAPGPLLPGGVYEFSFDAHEGQYLSLVTMFVQSNDLFYAPDEAGIVLFGMDGAPFSGEVTLSLWDAGTEANETPGAGVHQAPRQMAANDGEDENDVVRLVLADERPDTNGPVVKVTITAHQ